jgi:hypothetical protein
MKLVPSNDRKILPSTDSSLVTRMTEIRKLRERVRLAEAAEIPSGAPAGCRHSPMRTTPRPRETSGAGA